MNASIQTDAIAWWRMGCKAKADGYDIAAFARNIKYVAARRYFLAGAKGEPKPSPARVVAKKESPR